jgi:hypothetical protein
MRYTNARQMAPQIGIRFGLRVAGALCAVLAFASLADAAELVMFRRDGCRWCAQWDREIGPVYSKSAIGRRLPLRMVNIHRDVPPIRMQAPVLYTPTFVLAENGAEVGRIEGYPGDAFFWGLLERLVERLPQGAKGVGAPAPSGPKLGESVL